VELILGLVWEAIDRDLHAVAASVVVIGRMQGLMQIAKKVQQELKGSAAVEFLLFIGLQIDITALLTVLYF
jgi:hypothetical protein